MILTGSQIKKEVYRGNITIEPFHLESINPNTYNYRIGYHLKVFKKFDGRKSIFEDMIIPEAGYTLVSGQLYLGHTLETIGSKKFATSLVGRSSMGRLGLFLQVSANLGHTQEIHQWTLELVAAQPIKVYHGMVIGQVSFWSNYGKLKKYNGKYERYDMPQECLM